MAGEKTPGATEIDDDSSGEREPGVENGELARDRRRRRVA